VKESTEKI